MIPKSKFQSSFNELLTKWVFPFNRTEEILSTLRIQLSTRFRDLLVRSRQNRLFVPSAFAAEPGHITQIAIDKRELWELKLACAILKDRSRRIDERFAELESGFIVRRTKFLPGPETTNYIQNLLDDLMNTMDAASKILSEQLTPSFGPPGVPGDAEKIKAACDNLYSLYLTLFEWELDVRFVRPHEAFAKIFPKMQGLTTEMRTQFRQLTAQLDTLVSTPDLSGSHTITMTIKAPAGLDALTDEFRRMAQDSAVMTAIRRGV